MSQTDVHALTEVLAREIEEDPDIYLSGDPQAAYDAFCTAWHYEAMDNEEALPSHAEFMVALNQARLTHLG